MVRQSDLDCVALQRVAVWTKLDKSSSLTRAHFRARRRIAPIPPIKETPHG